ncbi:MAG: cellulase family glycosylhydrolase [Candidatus Omnitrophica bacterium]|nr:cellulase family glycosylhydrolase [Candidatus Omnitrophota bacterium]
MKFLRAKGANIVDGKGNTVSLRGLNLGGWLMMEGYFMHAPNFAEQLFKRSFAKALGDKALSEFENAFRGSFITEKDFKRVMELGCNSIRLPIDYRIVETKPGVFKGNEVRYIDSAINWAKKYGMSVILDLHAAPGAQNHDWHSNSLGKAGLWNNKSYQNRTYAIWEYLADRYRDETAIAGYDLLNEAVTDDIKLLNDFYKNTIKAVRRADKNHILFIEGNKWATNIECLDRFDDDNYALSIHNYEPLQFTFNLTPGLKYPLKDKNHFWDKDVTKRHLAKFKAISDQRKLHIYVGEFGVHYRDGHYNEHIWLKDVLKEFNSLGFSWSYWTFKAIKNFCFPDGVYSYYENSPWVNRQGPKSGWETYSAIWIKHKEEIISSWDTGNFTLNQLIAEAIKNGIQDNN